MFSPVAAAPLPAGALLEAYARPGHYVDCFRVHSSSPVDHALWLQAFLLSRAFRLERYVLRGVFGTPSDDAAVSALVAGRADDFAVWHVEHRAPQELLLQDRSARTRSWWRTELTRQHGTCLYFGSALVPPVDESGQARGDLGLWRYSVPMHRAYSRLLVRSACARLQAFS